MYFSDKERHHIPHIHISYSGKEAVVSIENAKIIKGELSRKTINLVKAWIDIHKDELMANWELAVNGQDIFRIDPLK